MKRHSNSPSPGAPGQGSPRIVCAGLAAGPRLADYVYDDMGSTSFSLTRSYVHEDAATRPYSMSNTVTHFTTAHSHLTPRHMHRRHHDLTTKSNPV
jgi:hypothetical protein